MALGYEESKRKYAEYLTALSRLGDLLAELGYTTQVQDYIELGGIYEFHLGGRMVARLSWNVPHYFKFENFIEEARSFDTDYVKNFREWSTFLSDAQDSLTSYANA
jgi:hypothetical protein